jgi:hypothetical protein
MRIANVHTGEYRMLYIVYMCMLKNVYFDGIRPLKDIQRGEYNGSSNTIRA